jgi:PKD repeat protein
MRGGYLVWILVLFSIGLVTATVIGIDLTLDKEIYGAGQDFGGAVVISTGVNDEISVHEQIRTQIVNCDDGDSPGIYHALYNVLDDANLFDGPEYQYVLGSSKSSVEDTDLYGFYFDGFIPEDGLEFDLAGEGGPFFIDVGSDGVDDWQYVGASEGFGSNFYPPGFEEITLSGNPDERLAEYGSCNEFDLEVSHFLDSIEIRVNAYAKREEFVDGENLRACVGNTDYCDDFCVLDGTGWDGVSSDWVPLTCTLEKSLLGFSGDQISVEVCVRTFPQSNNFLIPVYTGSGDDYYYITLNQQVFSEDLPAQEVTINSDILTHAVNSYASSCDDNCLIPFRVNSDSTILPDDEDNPVLSPSVSFVMDNLNLVDSGGTQRHNFYEVEESSNTVVLNGWEIPLDVFDLTVPDVITDDCSLEVQFGGQSATESFEIRESPEAVINIDSVYVLQNNNVIFDAGDSTPGEGATIVSYFWEFGDGTNSSSVSPTKAYLQQGEYEVGLTVKDSNNVTATAAITIYVVDFEEHITGRLIEIRSGLDQAGINFGVLSSSEQKVLDLLDVDFSFLSSIVDGLETNFTNLRDDENLNEVYRNSEYASIAVELGNIATSTPQEMYFRNTTSVINYNINLPGDIGPYSGVSSLTSPQRNAIYEFNQDNVNIDSEFEMFNVDFIDGEDNYVLVQKDVTVTSGNNNVLVEYLTNHNLDEVYSVDASEDVGFSNLYWPVQGSLDIYYLVKSDEVEVIKSVVFSDVDFDDSQTSGDYVCGDGLCTKILHSGIDESDKNSAYYCPEDCGGKFPWIWIIVLGIVLLFGIMYFWLYKGPGNLQNLSNKITFKLFRKKLFVTDKDKVILTNYIHHAMRRGFNRIEIRNALVRKGWNTSQIDDIFRNI